MTSEHDPDDASLDPDRARSHPEDAVDALERRIAADRTDEQDPAPGDDDGVAPAFAIDLDPDDQGDAGAAGGNPG